MPTSIHWFRKDLRLADNPALSHAARLGAVVPVYILEPEQHLRGASRAWLHASLQALNASLGGRLVLAVGHAGDILPELAQSCGAQTVTWTRRYDPAGMSTDTRLKAELKAQGVDAVSANGALLWEPMDINKPDGTPYRVFTPFFRKGCMSAPPPREPIPAPTITFTDIATQTTLDDLNLLPHPRWDVDVLSGWTPGEAGAAARLEIFLDTGLSDYRNGRDFPAQSNVSRLSPHLAFGEISPNTVWHAAREKPASKDRDHFQSELGWREFSYNLLFHNPDLATQNLNRKFDAYPWTTDPEALKRWQTGQTGIPIVDAGMRELWHTGYMHNRVRMIVASFLVKNLGLHWRDGLAWFDDTLFDADPANNPASWQWVAGSGADAAPYFRIFNPVTQSARFDAGGVYLRRWVPEVSPLLDKHLHAPWEAPTEVLRAANVVLGKTYPWPVVDLRESRQRALAGYDRIKAAAAR